MCFWPIEGKTLHQQNNTLPFIVILDLWQWSGTEPAKSLRDTWMWIGMGGLTGSICRGTCVIQGLKLSCGKSGIPTVQTGGLGALTPSSTAFNVRWCVQLRVPGQGIFTLYHQTITNTQVPKLLLPRKWRSMVDLIRQALKTHMKVAELSFLVSVWTLQQHITREKQWRTH